MKLEARNARKKGSQERRKKGKAGSPSFMASPVFLLSQLS